MGPGRSQGDEPLKDVLKHLWHILPAWALLVAISSGSFWALTALQDFPGSGAPPAVVMRAVLASTFLIACVLAYITLRSRWTGTQLVCAVFVVYFGVNTFVPISQAFLLVPGLMTPALGAVLTAHGFIVALTFSFALVLLTGRMWQPGPAAESARLHLPAGEWLWKLALSAGVSVGLYLLGQAVTRPYVSEFYGQAGLPPLGERVILQTGRALLLLAFVLPAIKMMKGGRWEAAVTVGLLLCILAGVTPLAMPTSVLPDRVRYLHMAEAGARDFVYGSLVGYLFSRQREGF